MMLRCRNRHIQTILPVILPKPKYEYRREYIPMEDGGQVCAGLGSHRYVEELSLSSLCSVE